MYSVQSSSPKVFQEEKYLVVFSLLLHKHLKYVIFIHNLNYYEKYS